MEVTVHQHLNGHSLATPEKYVRLINRNKAFCHYTMYVNITQSLIMHTMPKVHKF